MLLKNNYIVYLVSFLFIIINAVFIINEQYLFLFFPIIIILGYLLFYKLDILLLIIIALTPLSVNFENIGFGIGITLPTEPLLGIVLIVAGLNIFYNRGVYTGNNIVRHPVSISIIFYLFWILVTTLTSVMPFVSLKFLIAKLWFIIPFYFLGIYLFKNFRNFSRVYWLYIIPFVIIIFYTIINHYLNGFTQKSGNWVMKPFYNDHTSYGAILVMFLPFILGYTFNKNFEKKKITWNYLLILIFVVAIIFSYTRAAWISLIVALVLFIILKYRIKLIFIISTALIFAIFAFMFKKQIDYYLEKNNQDSSNNLVEHVQSMSNITTDASNLERLNRWNCAIRMFKENPIFGTGPGTYMFLYAPYQISNEKTIISTNSGDGGNAHSEYLGPLSESGLLGMISFLFIIITSFYTAIKVYFKSNDNKVKFFAIIPLLGLTTYVFHGILNNFLDTDKASIPFWLFISMIVALDIFYCKKTSEI